ncbi:MAG: hypothetical protein KC731_38960 [Myxococcales bacterium]|nr:hypothetical protein [Myxococcales bacterium]
MALGGLLVWLGVACATGGGTGETGSSNQGGNPSTGATPSTGSHMGGNGSVGGDMSVGGSGPGTGGTGGVFDDNCTEDPCKLVAPQCGCPPGQMCDWNNDVRSCVTEGTAAEGEVCGTTECAAGNLCLNNGGLATCHKYCDSNADCTKGPGSICVLQVNDPNMMPYTQEWCSDNCDPVGSAGCPAGSKCLIGQDGMNGPFFTLCVPGTGTGTQGQSCVDNTGCAPGYLCAGSPLQCLHWCNQTNGGTGCPSGVCNSFTTPITIGTVEYGACL